LFVVMAILFMFGTTQAEEGRLVYTGATDPEQVNGAVDGDGNISTTGDSVIIEGPWSVISTAPNKAAQMPGNGTFEAAWQYQGSEEALSSAIPNGNGNGLTIKFYADHELVDEYRMTIGNRDGKFELFWSTYDTEYGDTSWTNKDSVWSKWEGCRIISTPVPIPVCQNLKVVYNSKQYDVYYSVKGDVWTHVPEMVLKNEDLENRDVTFNNASSTKEFQFVSRDGKKVILDWLIIKGEGYPNFNKDVNIGAEYLGVH